MNVIRFIGGIGNQMFQYGFGKVLSLQGKAVSYDLSWYDTKGANHPLYPRPFRLGMFQIDNIRIQPFASDNPTIYDKHVGYNSIVFQQKGDVNFDGYWQYYGYYKDIISKLQKEFQLKTEFYTKEFLELADIIMDSNSVSVHVRRGDYQLHRVGAFRDLPANYYFSAIKHIEGDLFIFSDDIPWCIETFKPEYFSRKLYFVDMEDYLAFELMRLCKHNIITNSSFSWWAALMNENTNKKVISPLHYLGYSKEDSIQYRYPKEWIKIEDYAVNVN